MRSARKDVDLWAGETEGRIGRNGANNQVDFRLHSLNDSASATPQLREQNHGIDWCSIVIATALTSLNASLADLLYLGASQISSL